MNRDEFILDFESLTQTRSPSEYNQQALQLLQNEKRFWQKEAISKGWLGQLFPVKKRLCYEPQNYLFSLIDVASKHRKLMPYIALYQVFNGNGISCLRDAIYQASCLEMMELQPLASGYDHCIGFPLVIYGLAADRRCLEKLMPIENGASVRGHTSLRAFTNMLMGLWYGNDKILSTGYEQTQKLISLKSSKKLDIAIGHYLMALADRDTETALVYLLDICKSAPKDKGDSIIPFNKPLGQYFLPEIHGLVVLAHHVLHEDAFQQLLSFDGPHYYKKYTEYVCSEIGSRPASYVTFIDELKILNILIENIPASHIYFMGNNPFVDTERYKSDRLEMLAVHTDLEEHFCIYNRV